MRCIVTPTVMRGPPEAAAQITWSLSRKWLWMRVTSYSTPSSSAVTIALTTTIMLITAVLSRVRVDRA